MRRLLVPTVSPFAMTAGVQARTQIAGRIPSKGYREQPPIPDRLKDAFSQFGSDPNRVDGNQDPVFMPEERRQRMLQSLTSSTQNIKNYHKMDRLRVALDAVHNKAYDDEAWLEAYLFLRTTEFCCELVKTPDDVFPKGHKLWIELPYCEEKRVPTLLELPNGMIVLPVFSMEEYMDHYFSLVRVFDSCWFPVPRTGSERWEEFCALEFPVGATGALQHYSTLATIAYPEYPFAILVNPGQRSSKFLTYPEMVELAKIKQASGKERNLDLKERNADGTLSGRFVFDTNLMACYDTRKMKMKRIEPHELQGRMRHRPPIPPVAQMELQLLLCQYAEISAVWVRSVERPRWRTVLGASGRMTQIEVIPVEGRRPPAEFFSHLQRWSFMREFKSDIHVELTSTLSPDTPGSQHLPPPMCLYTAEDGELLRSMCTYRGITVADAVGYHDPIVDKAGRKVYEPYGNYV